ncbi:hypothetical protein [uncultured Sphingomonas sp.]|jgi:hypothetical protein|uniref:hypothetical protein n=1 Tax=Sphingomonas hankookensis TaxID=563996 RepID=UPI00259494A7|nr:hypothetical protein [uncultured Sphingomonas sp.]
MPLPPPAPPPCIVVGDSIAVGTADALASAGLRCAVHARVGASSAETLRGFRDDAPRAHAIIALGSNDLGRPDLLRNLVALRQRVRATRVTWVAPYAPAAAAVSTAVARSFGDDVVQLSRIESRDGIHPVSYRLLIRSLDLSPGRYAPLAPTGAVPTPSAPAHRPVRQAVVMTF